MSAVQGDTFVIEGRGFQGGGWAAKGEAYGFFLQLAPECDVLDHKREGEHAFFYVFFSFSFHPKD